MIVWPFFTRIVLAMSVCAGDEHKLVRHRLTTFTEICHKTGNKKCPWNDLQINAKALQGHIGHGDKLGSCASTCNGCDVFDKNTCRCKFVSCSPTNSPSSSPTASPSSSPTTSPTSSPTAIPTSSPTASPSSSPTAFCQDKPWQCRQTLISCGNSPVGFGCYCSYTTEGTPFCRESDSCGVHGDCSSTTDCPTGTYCIPNTCCQRSVCRRECPNPGVGALPEGVETAQIGFTNLDTCEATSLDHCPPKL